MPGDALLDVEGLEERLARALPAPVLALQVRQRKIPAST
jgi:hypothetical protein